MAFDGITVAAIVSELNDKIIDSRINKISQVENDTLLITLKSASGQQRLLMSSNASLPFVYLTASNRPAPLNAPGFCMLLRKMLGSGKITGVYQPGLERIIIIEIEHFDDLGDLKHKKLITELMGKHSNIILTDENDKIIDSIKHVPSSVSSVREVLPGRNYFITNTLDKKNPLSVTSADFKVDIFSQSKKTVEAIFNTYSGISPASAEEICFIAGIDGDSYLEALSVSEHQALTDSFLNYMEIIKTKAFKPATVFKNGVPVDYSAVSNKRYESFGGYELTFHNSISELLESFYYKKELHTRILSKSSDLRRIVNTAIERNVKKLDLQKKQLKDTEKREKYKLYGELLQAYGHNASQGAKNIEVLNYYTNENMVIPLDPTLSAMENSNKYFTKYNKLKRTAVAMAEQLDNTAAEINYLKTVSNSLDIALSEADLSQIKEELIKSGFIKKHMMPSKGGAKGKSKDKSVKNPPLHYLSSDGFDIYVGKNNIQNEEITFKTANGGDWWFHAKGIPGSHVIVKTMGDELPDRTFEEAARIAGFYSSGRETDKLEIDYLQRKNVKKPGGAAPGFVVYYTNYSMTIHPDISGIKEVTE